MSNIPPPSPTQVSQVSEAMEEWPEPPAVHRVWEGKVWALEVVQQPVRARMCGFGDKVSTIFSVECYFSDNRRTDAQFHPLLVSG